MGRALESPTPTRESLTSVRRQSRQPNPFQKLKCANFEASKPLLTIESHRMRLSRNGNQGKVVSYMWPTRLLEPLVDRLKRDLPNGSPHFLLKTKQKLSKMSLNLFSHGELECATSSSTKVANKDSVVPLCSDSGVLDTKVVYRRYASLFFIAGCASTDNELVTLEIVHRYVEQMDKYYGNVCELDIIFNFQKAYFILDELLLAGEMQESSKKNVLRCISQQDSLEDMEVSG
ncbi:MAG: hypothetical protein MMC33_001624 [Icmadophila ericetorum]|nr:hypothetical protein [Icmadophila ericetorum]